MLIKSCLNCKYHKMVEERREQMSYCEKESCWSQYSKCLAGKALSRLLEQERSDRDRPFSALNFVYPTE